MTTTTQPWQMPNEADRLCQRFEMGIEQPDDFCRLTCFIEMGQGPIYFHIDSVTKTPKRKQPPASADNINNTEAPQ